MGLFKKDNKEKPVFSDKNEMKKTLHENLDFTAVEQYKLIGG